MRFALSEPEPSSASLFGTAFHTCRLSADYYIAQLLPLSLPPSGSAAAAPPATLGSTQRAMIKGCPSVILVVERRGDRGRKGSGGLVANERRHVE